MVAVVFAECVEPSAAMRGAKLPTGLLGLTWYGEATTPAEIRAVNQKLRKAIETEDPVARINGLWKQWTSITNA